MCMTFGYNPQNNFCHFFHSLNLVIFGLNYYWSLWTLGTLWAQLLLQFIPILLKLYRCFWQELKMCMTFGYNPQINFCRFFHSLNLVIFGLNYYWSLWTLGTLWAQLLTYNFIPILLKLYMCFCQGLKMCMTFGYNHQITFCHFFHSLNLVIFGLNYYRSLWTLDTLWVQLLLQFYIRIMLL